MMVGNNFTRAKEVAAWRKRLDQNWSSISLRRMDDKQSEIRAGEVFPLRVAARLNNLRAEDVLVECLVGLEAENGEFTRLDSHVFTSEGRNEAGETLFKLDLHPRLSGLQYYKIRMYPFHPALCHRFESGYMLWL
jgi:starch phosphorylase